MAQSILELAKNVDRAKEQLVRAEQQLLAALTGTQLNRRNTSVRRDPGGPSTAARVLSLVEDAGPAGITRADLHAKLPGMEKAIHSALKYQSAQKKIWSDDGRWKAASTRKPATRQPSRQTAKKAQEAVGG